MISDKRIIGMYVLESKSVLLTRIQDFRQYSDEKLPGVASINDGIARHSELGGIHKSDNHAEGVLMKHSRSSAFQQNHRAIFALGPVLMAYFDRSKPTLVSRLLFMTPFLILTGEQPSIVSTNRFALQHIGVRQEDARYETRSVTWVFRLKPLDNDGKAFLHKARCEIRGDKQTAYVDFDPNNVYEPVVCHGAIRILLDFASAHDLLMEGADISNTYLYGKIDIRIIMTEPTNSSGIPERPGIICRLLRSLYSLCQAGEIWGYLICQTLLPWGFKVSNVDKRIIFLVAESEFFILVVVVDDMVFVSNSTALMSRLKQKPAATFDVRLFGRLQTFIGWEVKYLPNGIKVTQTRYAKDLISRCGMENCNAVWSPLPTTEDLTSSRDEEVSLSSAAHSEYRSFIRALIHLAVSTRPGMSFPVCTHARHVNSPMDRHRTFPKRFLRYIAGKTEYGLQYNRKPITETSLAAHVDADWGGYLETRHSTTGYIVRVNGLISLARPATNGAGLKARGRPVVLGLQ